MAIVKCKNCDITLQKHYQLKEKDGSGLYHNPDYKYYDCLICRRVWRKVKGGLKLIRRVA